MNIIKRYFVNLSNLKLVSYLIVLNMINFLSPISALGFENKFEKSKYFNKLDSSKVLEPNSNNFPKLYNENLNKLITLDQYEKKFGTPSSNSNDAKLSYFDIFISDNL